jgi:hypothetical protein
LRRGRGRGTADLRRRHRRGENNSGQECANHCIGPLLWPLPGF